MKRRIEEERARYRITVIGRNGERLHFYERTRRHAILVACEVLQAGISRSGASTIRPEQIKSVKYEDLEG